MCKTDDKPTTTQRSEADAGGAGLKRYTNRGSFETGTGYAERDMYDADKVDAVLAEHEKTIGYMGREIDRRDAEIAFHEETIRQNRAVMKSLGTLAEIGRLAVEKRKAQIHKDNTPAGDIREVLLRRADLLDADANLDDATNAYLTTPAKRDTEDER